MHSPVTLEVEILSDVDGCLPKVGTTHFTSPTFPLFYYLDYMTSSLAPNSTSICVSMDSHTSDNPTIPNSIPLQGLRVPTSASRPVVNGFLEHPIRSLSPGQVAEEVDAFVNLNNLDDLRDLLHQAGQVARSPYAPQNIGELEPADVAALRNENVRPFHHPSKLWICLATCSTAAALQGWSQVGFLPKADEIWLGLDPNSFQLGAVASSPYFVAALCGCWLSAPLNERFGRRSPLLAAAVVNLLAAFGAACSQHWWQVLICRSLTGVSMGLKASVAPILAAEVAPPSIRGSVVMGAWQICVAGGILL